MHRMRIAPQNHICRVVSELALGQFGFLSSLRNALRKVFSNSVQNGPSLDGETPGCAL